jgi:hypothetical protein
MEQHHPAGLLQPLQVPSTVRADVAMDFIEALPKVSGKSVILTLVDRFFRYAHFIPLGHPYTVTTVVHAFFTDIIRLHGLPTSIIISDCDPMFTRQFWGELFWLSDVRLHKSTTFHPQSDGQSEAVNRIMTMYLCCLTDDRPRQWVQWLPWAEFCYNSAFQSSLRTTPFRVVYGLNSPAVPPYAPSSEHVPVVYQQLAASDEFLTEVRDRLEQAHQLYKEAYDKNHTEVMFTVGDWVWLRLLHRPITSICTHGRCKLGPRFYGPFQIKECVGDIAYKLEFPSIARLHDLFHVVLLRLHKGAPPQVPGSLPPMLHDRAFPQSAEVIKGHLACDV